MSIIYAKISSWKKRMLRSQDDVLQNIPHICHRHHRRCLCKKFLSGINFSRLSEKKCIYLTFSETFLVFLVPLVIFLGVKFGFRKSCLFKRNDKYEVWTLWLNWKNATRSKRRRDQADHLGFHSHWFSSGQHTTAPEQESCFSGKWSENINYVYPRENQVTNQKCGRSSP